MTKIALAAIAATALLSGCYGYYDLDDYSSRHSCAGYNSDGVGYDEYGRMMYRRDCDQRRDEREGRERHRRY